MDNTGQSRKKPEEIVRETKVIPWAEGNGLWHTLSDLITDLSAVDIVTFFVQNPYACDTAEGLALRTGRKAPQVEPVLESLAEAGLLHRTQMEDMCVYTLTDDPNGQQTLQQYAAWIGEGYHWVRMVMGD